MDEGIGRRKFNQLMLWSAVLLWYYQELNRVAAANNSAGSIVPETMAGNTIKVNGITHSLPLDSRTTLLDFLRNDLALTGTKKGCDHGQCGSCTVLVNGQRVKSCLSFALMHEGNEITTIEGLTHGEELHPMQASFLEHDGFQCGYCTPGQIMSAVGLMHEPCGKSDAEVRECMSGNICRCGAYNNIVAAIQSVRSACSH